jgi:hypothetical protein
MKTMKRIVAESMRMILLAIALALPAYAANADPLPDGYLGRWCFNGSTYEPAETEKDWEACHAGISPSLTSTDGNYMEIRRDGWVGKRYGGQENCKFISIQGAREKIPLADDIGRDVWKGSWRPVLHISVRCTDENTTWKQQMTFKWGRGGTFTIMAR